MLAGLCTCSCVRLCVCLLDCVRVHVCVRVLAGQYRYSLCVCMLGSVRVHIPATESARVNGCLWLSYCIEDKCSSVRLYVCVRALLYRLLDGCARVRGCR